MEGVLALNDDDQIIYAFVKSEDEISSVEGFHFVNEHSVSNGHGDDEQWQQQLQEQEAVDDNEILLQEQAGHRQEVLVYNGESGEYQKFFYISEHEATTEEEAVEVHHEDEASDNMNGFEQIMIEEGENFQFGADRDHDGYVFLQETSEAKEDSSNLTEIFQSEEQVMEEIEVPEEYEDVQHQVPEELVSHQFGTHFLAVQGDDFSEPVDKKPKFSSPVVMRTSVVKCDKCHRNIKSEEFRSHYRDVHLESSSTDATKNQFKVCSLCNRTLSRKDYLTHFAHAHTDVRLGCPKCPQTYHSPELLNVHYRHFHAQQPPQVNDTSAAQENSELETRPQQCQIFVQNLDYPNSANRIAQSFSGGSAAISSTATSTTRRGSEFSLQCDICNKSYRSQREFTNHRRRKDFCKPPPPPSPPADDRQAQKRRIGIIRRSL